MRKTIVCASNKQICRQITNHVDTNRPALHPLILVLRVMTFISYVISSTVESPEKRYPHTVLFFKIYAVEIGHQFRARGIIRIGQDYISSEYEQVPMGRF